jgi:hypothetical protein
VGHYSLLYVHNFIVYEQISFELKINLKIMASEKEHDLNACLAGIIPIVYGAVFSYAMYVFAHILSKWLNSINQADVVLNNENITNTELIGRVILFGIITMFMIEDVGAIIKLEKAFPFKRTARYTLEVVIAFFYILIYTLLGEGLFWTIPFFGVLLVLCGFWFHRFRNEYEKDETKIDRYANTIGNFHYVGAFIILGESAWFMFYRHLQFLNGSSVVWFTLTLLVWINVTLLHCVSKHGENSLNYCVNILLPKSWIRRTSSSEVVQ